MEEKFFQEAIALAKKGLGHTAPNPAVGAVLVQGGKIIGKGWHKKSGCDHAEVCAIDDAKKQGHGVKGASIYVTLEPCRHVGKTPACTDRLIEEGIKAVHIGMRDPFRLVNGKGLHVLKKAGIDTSCLSKRSPLYPELLALNQPFLKWVATGLPYVTMKAATSLDGCIATGTGESKWITSEKARIDARKERSQADVIIVGAGTVRADNPELAAHGTWKQKKLLRVIIDPKLSVDPASTVFRDEHVLVATTDKAAKTRRTLFDRHDIAYRSFGTEIVSMKKLLQYLGKQNKQHVFVEGGSGVHGSFFHEFQHDPLVIDRVVWYMAPMIIGGGLSAVSGPGLQMLEQRRILQEVKTVAIGEDIKIIGTYNTYDK